MVARLSKALVLYSADVYLEVIASGSTIPASGELRFPIDTRGHRFFNCRVGQMAVQTPTEDDFEEVADIYVDRLPSTPDHLLDIGVMLYVDETRTLYIEINFHPRDSIDLLREGREFGPFSLD